MDSIVWKMWEDEVDSFEHNRNPMSAIADPIYGEIPISFREQAILDTPEFQRLKRLKQLGFLWLVKPGAIHTRFDHSLGVYHLARNVLDLISLGWKSKIDGLWNQQDANTLLAAALLHDIGHYSYPQAVERLYPLVPKHETLSTYLICNSRIAHVLQNYWEVDPERVASIINPSSAKLLDSDQLLSQLLSGDIDLDKIDYVSRDIFHCGFGHIGDLVEQILSSYEILQMNSHCKIGVSDSHTSLINSLIEMRQYLTMEAYGHNLNRAATVMLSRAIQDSLSEGTITVQDLAQADDFSLFDLLKNRAIPGSSTSTIVRRIAYREWYVASLDEIWDRSKVNLIDSLRAPEERLQAEIRLCRIARECLDRPLADYDLLLDILPINTCKGYYRVRLFAADNVLAQTIKNPKYIDLYKESIG